MISSPEKRNIDAVFCIDGTAGMDRCMENVDADVREFHWRLVRSVKDTGCEVGSVRIRIIVFRDYGADGDGAMELSPFFTLPKEYPAFDNFLAHIEGTGGGDPCENGLEALYYAATSYFCTGENDVRAVVLFTDSDALPLGERGGMGYPCGMTDREGLIDALKKVELYVFAPRGTAYESVTAEAGGVFVPAGYSTLNSLRFKNIARDIFSSGFSADGCTANVISSNDCEREEEELFPFTLAGPGGEREEFVIDSVHMGMIRSHALRIFYPRRAKEAVLDEIERAPDHAALERITSGYDICDTLDLTDIALPAAKAILCAVTDVIYKYPRVRGKLCHIGTPLGYERLLARLRQGDEEAVRSLGLTYIFDNDEVRAFARIAYARNIERIFLHDIYSATTVSELGLADAVLFDHHDFGSDRWELTVAELADCERTGFHPTGCMGIEAMAYHEMGHVLDDLCIFCQSHLFREFYNGLNKSRIKTGLSEYAATLDRELIAEAFSECMSSPSPRLIAKKVGALLDELYKKYFD